MCLVYSVFRGKSNPDTPLRHQLEAPPPSYDRLEVECLFQIEVARGAITKMSEDSSTSTDSATAGLGSSK